MLNKNGFSNNLGRSIRRGDIFFADLGENNIGSEQSGKRPVIIIQNDMGNKFSPTVIVAVLTSRLTKKDMPTHMKLSSNKYNLAKDSIILLEQQKTIDKNRLFKYIDSIRTEDVPELDKKIAISNGTYYSNIAKTKATEIAILDRVITQLKNIKMDNKELSSFTNERVLRIKDLSGFCNKHSLQVKDYYDINYVENKEVI